MTDESKPPAGLKVERTASGRFRIELPRDTLGLKGRVIWSLLILGCAVLGAYLIWRACHADSLPGIIGNAVFAALAVGMAFLLFYLLAITLGRQSLEVDDQALIHRSSTAFLPEWRSRTALKDLTDVTVAEEPAPEGRSVLCLKARTVQGEEDMIASKLPRDELEWLAARVRERIARLRGGIVAADGALPAAKCPAVELTKLFRDGTVRPEHIEPVDPDESAPKGSKIEILERRSGLLRVRLGGRRLNALLVFGLIFAGIAAVGAYQQMRRGSAGDAWEMACCFGTLSLALVVFGIHQFTTREIIEVRPDGADYCSTSIFRRRSRSLSGPGLSLWQEARGFVNDSPLWYLCMGDPAGRSVSFAAGLRAESQVWLLAHIAKVLGPDSLGVPEAWKAMSRGAPPPAGSGIEVLEEREGLLRLRVTGRTGHFWVVVWSIGLLLLAGLVAVCLAAILTHERGWTNVKYLGPLVAFTAVAISFLWQLRKAVAYRDQVEELTVQAKVITCERRAGSRTKKEQVAGPTLTVGRHGSSGVFASEGPARAIVFADKMMPAGQVWLLGRISAVLHPEESAKNRSTG